MIRSQTKTFLHVLPAMPARWGHVTSTITVSLPTSGISLEVHLRMMLSPCKRMRDSQSYLGSLQANCGVTVREKAGWALQFGDSPRLGFGTGSGVQKSVKFMVVNSLLLLQGWTSQTDPKLIFKLSQPWPQLLLFAPAPPTLNTHAIFRASSSKNIHRAPKFPGQPCQGGNCLNNWPATDDKVKILHVLMC